MSISESRIEKHMTAAERWADTKEKVQLRFNKGWTIGQIGLQLHLAESSVRTLLGYKKR